MSIQNEIKDLVQAEVISEETAARIEAYYARTKGQSQNRLMLVFAILGALLVGSGIMLIIAHNWDNFPRSIKTLFAFLPLVIGQAFCGYTLLKKKGSTAWQERTAIFLFFGVGASIAMIGQIYNLPGDMTGFILTWMLLCLPIVYLMDSAVVSLFYIYGISYYTCAVGYGYKSAFCWEYWLLLGAILPYYWYLYTTKAHSNFTLFHHIAIAISLTACIGTLTNERDYMLLIPLYMALFGVFYLLGNTDAFAGRKVRQNPYRIIGAVGTTSLLFFLSFEWYWGDIHRKAYSLLDLASNPATLGVGLLTIIGVYLLVQMIQKANWQQVNPLSYTFLLFLLILGFGLRISSFIPIVLINILLFLIGLWTIRKGAAEKHLGILNYGLIILTGLIMARFFDLDLSFIFRGVLFILIGSGFFMANYSMLKRRKASL